MRVTRSIYAGFLALLGVVKMHGQVFGTSASTLSADGKTLTVHNTFSAGGAQRAGAATEVWVKQ